MYRSKWHRFNILAHIEEHYPDIYLKLMGLEKHSRLQIGNFVHNKYGRLFANKIYIKRENKTILIFKTENPFDSSATTNIINKSNKAFMNEWIKKDLKKLSV